MHQKRKIFFIGIAFLIALGSFLQYRIPDQKLKLFFFDVGQGDSIFIKTPGNVKILVDGGASKKILTEFGQYISFWNRSIDYLILTHPDFDHYGGLAYIAKRYRIKTFLTNGDFKSHPAFTAFLQALKKQKTNIKLIARDSDFSLDDGTNIDFLLPEKASLEFDAKNPNERSVVFLLESKNKKILLTGDIDDKIETKLLPRFIDIDILKVAHHGSRYGSTTEFLKKTKPEIGIIQVGKENRYGHPSPETMQRLTEAGVSVYRTDIDGAVRFSF